MAVCGTLRAAIFVIFKWRQYQRLANIATFKQDTHIWPFLYIYPVVSKSINNKTHCQWHFGSMTAFEPKYKRCLMIKFEPPLFPRYFIKISISTCRSNQRPSPSSSSSSFKDDTYYHPHYGPLISIKNPGSNTAIQILDFCSQIFHF